MDVLWLVDVECKKCGVEKWIEIFFVCPNNCKNVSEHRYCMELACDNFQPDGDWTCKNCEALSDVPLTPRRSARLRGKRARMQPFKETVLDIGWKSQERLLAYSLSR
ncbi:hypothetical protein Dimus_039436 [Dionaea muscipula]